MNRACDFISTTIPGVATLHEPRPGHRCHPHSRSQRVSNSQGSSHCARRQGWTDNWNGSGRCKGSETGLQRGCLGIRAHHPSSTELGRFPDEHLHALVNQPLRRHIGQRVEDRFCEPAQHVVQCIASIFRSGGNILEECAQFTPGAAKGAVGQIGSLS
ncbi:hypothetical protein D3C81_1684690 [compost metagenome]